MTNFDPAKPQEIMDYVLAQLPRHELMALSTINTDGSPWVVCVNMSYDPNLNFIWKSAHNSEHSKNIVSNQQVSICVFSKTKEYGEFAFYSQGVAHEITDENELKAAIKARYEDKNVPVPQVTDFQGDSHVRLYKAALTIAWVNDDRHLKTPVDLGLLK